MNRRHCRFDRQRSDSADRARQDSAGASRDGGRTGPRLGNCLAGNPRARRRSSATMFRPRRRTERTCRGQTDDEPRQPRRMGPTLISRRRGPTAGAWAQGCSRGPQALLHGFNTPETAAKPRRDTVARCSFRIRQRWRRPRPDQAPPHPRQFNGLRRKSASRA